MPIVSRVLEYVSPVQPDGRVRVVEAITDKSGRVWRRNYKAASEAQAITDMNARNLTSRMRNQDFNELRRWVEAGNTVASFDWVNRDLTENKGEERISRFFARNRGEKVHQLAWWIDSLTGPEFNVIRNRIGWTPARRNRVRNRAAAMAANTTFDDTEDVD